MSHDQRLAAIIAGGHSRLSAQAIIALQDKLTEMTDLYERHQKWRSMDLKNIRKHEETIRLKSDQLRALESRVRELYQETQRQAARIKELEWQYSSNRDQGPLIDEI